MKIIAYYLMIFLYTLTLNVSLRQTRLYSTKKIAESVVMPPANWLQQWNNIELMRSQDKSAPVDTMGAHALVMYPSYESTDKETRFRALIATMLSPQTKDKQTSIAYYNIEKLLLPKQFLPSNLKDIPINDLEIAIKSVLYYKTKAKNILLASELCYSKFNDDLPSDINDLLKFPGVGPKIAYLTFTVGWNKTLGICVDTHVHRITNRLGWVNTWNSKSNGPEKTRIQLQKWLPNEYWDKINYLFVGFGQTVCDSKLPKCNNCLLMNSCKYYNDNTHMK